MAIASVYGEHAGAVGGGGARERHDEPRVVLELPVPVQQRPAQPVGAQRRGEPPRLVGADGPRAGEVAGAQA
jgi:hypothetical protein